MRANVHHVIVVGAIIKFSVHAGIAQLVEHHVANVDVASSSLVSRSTLFHQKETK